MKGLQLLLAWCCTSALGSISCLKVNGYSCVSTYWDTVTCVLNITDNPEDQPTYSLKFIDYWRGMDDVICPISVTNHIYSSVCKVLNGTVFNSNEYYTIKLCNGSECYRIAERFDPSDNIKLTPPHEPEVQQTPETLNITWKSGYERHPYLKILQYEVSLQPSQSKEDQTIHPKSREQFVLVQISQLKSASHCIKVRSKPTQSYRGTWSNWSPSTCWKNEAGEGSPSEPNNTLIILIKSMGPVLVVVGVLLFVMFSPTARMKIKTLSHTPSPAPFFQPLFQQHEGNLQEWLSPNGKRVLPYKTEEILATNAVIIEPKPVTMEPEKKQDFCYTSVSHLVFTQCQSAYVGLPGIHEASPPIKVVSPGDTSYTQLPSSVWGVGSEEVEIASSPPKDFFNISRADSGCSCENMTQSPECSLPSSPVDDSPPPCSTSGYCILNKTAEGFAPVLVSKGSTTTDSQQKDEI